VNPERPPGDWQQSFLSFLLGVRLLRSLEGFQATLEILRAACGVIGIRNGFLDGEFPDFDGLGPVAFAVMRLGQRAWGRRIGIRP